MTTLKTIRNNLTSKQNAIVDQYQNFIDSFGMEYDTFFSYILEIYSTKDEIEDFKQFSEDAEDIRKEEDSSDNKSKADFDSDSNLYNTIRVDEKYYDEDILDLKIQMEKLSDIDRKIINERYINDLSQSEVSKQMCMTQSMVSRKEKEILTRLRVRLR